MGGQDTPIQRAEWGPCLELRRRGGWDLRVGFAWLRQHPREGRLAVVWGGGTWAPGGRLAVAQTPSLEGLASPGLGTIPGRPDQEVLDWGCWSVALWVAPGGHT